MVALVGCVSATVPHFICGQKNGTEHLEILDIIKQVKRLVAVSARLRARQTRAHFRCLMKCFGAILIGANTPILWLGL
jgi:hypothetical protein